MEEKDINQLNIEELDRIPVPDGLEQRLEAKIDEWDADSRIKPLSAGIRHRNIIVIAASFILICGIGLYLALSPSGKGMKDTYSDPQRAYQEAEQALILLSANLNKGLDQYEKAVQ